jgi:predicted oxidoreductase
MTCKRCGQTGLLESDLCGDYGCVTCFDGTKADSRKRIDEIVKKCGIYDSRKDQEGYYEHII